MATIAPIDDRTIHQIQSGQVIVDLCSVVKELVENSLDAAATSIEVRFKNQGLDSIEVQDNGSGISPENYETVALKHHTSKLATYSDLSSLDTFGFRGEALSSLCALSQFTVTTCLASDAPKGTKLEFATSGKLVSTSVVAAQKGTTVTVENLFSNLPVRRRELERNIKREWGRVTGVLQQYACIQTGVKFTVTQQQAKGKKTTLFSTKGNRSTRENIVNVFGAKTLAALLSMDLKLEFEPTSGPGQRWSTQEDSGSKDVRIVGHISRPAYGEGRQTPDRQMFFVNSRPCGLPQVAKAFNEVYKSYNSTQSPYIFANIEMDTHMYDVNVSPDKRTILLHDQTRMLEHLKISLTDLFESQDYTVPISQLPSQKQLSYKQLKITQQKTQPSESSPTSPSSTISDGDTRRRSASECPEQHEEEASIQNRFQSEPVKAPQQESPALATIGNWFEKQTENRGGERDANSKQIDTIPKGKLKLIEKLVKDPVQVNYSAPVDSSSQEAKTSPSTPSLSYKPPRQVQDFNKRMAEAYGEDIGEINHTEVSSTPVLEEAIPALISPARLTTSAVGIPTTNTRLPRAPAATATITIGDRTVTSSIGSLGPKGSRNKESVVSNAAGPLSSFGTRLSQRFGASDATRFDQLDELAPVLAATSKALESPPSSSADEETLFNQVDSKGFDEHQIIATTGDEQELALERSSTSSLVDGSDSEYIDEDEKKAQEDAKVQKMILTLEQDAACLGDSSKRARVLNKGGSRRKYSTVHLVQVLDASLASIESQLKKLDQVMSKYDMKLAHEEEPRDALDSATAEEKLSLTILKSDFAKMKIIGQFNLGFILACRTSFPLAESSQDAAAGDDLFIIDQHASDEKYNFERLQATTVVQSQRLVNPKILELTAVEEEIVIENLGSLESNGFVVRIDDSGEAPVGRRCQLVSLPISRETTFSLSDLEELISLLSEHPAGSSLPPPRPARVRKMFAMRACRSSVMVGRTLTQRHMTTLVRHMGEIDKPWNCPHGRPTMRHLCGLAAWDEVGWSEGDGLDGGTNPSTATNWTEYVRRSKTR
ncbi:MAG: hypothetical protein M1818_006238 [Claussenomyces sp. TS43310]|nr:MAG: hypothetical protein M1818_006238 [Claussenomyces sp. TS43310]